MRRLYFRGYRAGLSNNLLALEMGVALAYLTRRTLVPFGHHPPLQNTASALPAWQQSVTSVLDLYEVPVPLVLSHLGDTHIPASSLRPDAERLALTFCNEAFFYPHDLPIDHDHFFAFLNGRSLAHTLTPAQEQASDLIVDGATLGQYAYCLYTDDDHAHGLRALLRSVRLRAPYLSLALSIAAALFPFNAVHIRRTDFVTLRFTPRVAQVTGAEVRDNLATCMDPDTRLLICTDGAPEDPFFTPLRELFREVVFLDRYLQEDPGVQAALRFLPHRDDAVLAVLTRHIASEAGVFVGTLFSTFTGLIHRLRGAAGREGAFRYCYNDWPHLDLPYEGCAFLPDREGPFSWNRFRFPVPPEVGSWFREWPESYEPPAPLLLPPAPPEGTITLRARDAVVWGATARYEGHGCKDNIGYWTDVRDSVCLSFQAPGGRYRVALRYACGPGEGGSEVVVLIDGQPMGCAVIRETGSWVHYLTIPLPDPISLRGGAHQILIAVHLLARSVVMNLRAVLLIPAPAPGAPS